MNEADNTEAEAGKKKPTPPPRYDHIITPGFVARPGAKLPVTVHTAIFPAGLLARIQRAWNSNPKARSPYLPAYALRELVEQVEPAVLAVESRLGDGPWLHALHQPHNELPLQLALEFWITTHVAPHQDDVDWPTLVKRAMPLDWAQSEVDLLARGRAVNGTAIPHSRTFSLLATYIAGRWVDAKLALPGHTAKGFSVLGPLTDRGERSVYSWPPRELNDDEAYGLWTHRTALRVVSMPHDDRLVLRAVPHIARFGGAQPAYIPRRGDGPPSATVLLYLPKGALRDIERPMLLRAPVTVTGKKEDMRWHWQPGIARILPSLPSSRHYPNPEKVRAEPRYAAGITRSDRDADDPIAMLLHANGYTYITRTDLSDEPPAYNTHGHPADTGLQPIDHLTLFEHLKEPLAELGFDPLSALDKTPQRRAPRLTPARPDAEYLIELWHCAPKTYQAVHLALTRLLNYQHLGERTAEPGVHDYVGPTKITLLLRNPGSLVSGLTRPPAQAETEARKAHRKLVREQRAEAVRMEFPEADRIIGALVEIDKPVNFAMAGEDDPKRFLKDNLPQLNRHVQCLHPVTAPPKPNAKSAGLKPFEDSDIRCEDVQRAASSVKDLLRSLGHLPRLPAPLGVTGTFELVTVHIAYTGSWMIPFVLRMDSDGNTTAQLVASASHPQEVPIPLEELPRALTSGRGRMRRRDRAQLADFITQALALDCHAERLFLARAQTLRNKEVWSWLQNPHINPDALRLPGEECSNPHLTAGRHPKDLPGLRIVRINEEPYEIPLAFGANLDDEPDDLANGSPIDAAVNAGLCPEAAPAGADLPYKEWGRYSGVVPWNDHTFLAINPRSDTHQLPKTVSKYAGEDQNATRHGANPTSLEIHVSFQQPRDRAVDLAAYVNNLRRCHLHTDTPTRLPLLLHLAKLMEEYIG
ncbi:RNaseH domain-containing protein [Streptomyces sp. NRRL S-448]|uniref:RNaseH domain-containing protein n=1 Tax=Streptomyces sp. NRRL S-448 TaxID=1463907 RepID=UPI003564D381